MTVGTRHAKGSSTAEVAGGESKSTGARGLALGGWKPNGGGVSCLRSGVRVPCSGYCWRVECNKSIREDLSGRV